jgi:hypothetical protein
MPNAMTTDKIKNINQTLGFFSITVGWTLTNFLYSIYLGWTYGKATDSGVVLSWSGLFIYIAWAIFIIYPLNKLDHNKPIFRRQLFPFVTAGYAGLVYTILVGGLFRDFDLVIMFMPLALSIGLFFGLTYSTLITSDRIINLLNNKPIFKLISFFSPAFILTFFLWLLPTLFPSLVYRYMPDEIQDKIFVKTIVKYKVGDSFEKLRSEVPGHFDKWGDNGYYSGPLIEYHLETASDTIKILDIKLPK